jgi:hypothetical protein
MPRTLLILMSTIGMTAGIWLPADPAEAASTLPELAGDSVTGTGSTETLYHDVVVDATSDASGNDPTGTVVFDVFGIPVEGPITCLEVHENEAVLGFDDGTGPFGSLSVHVVDNGATGDVFGALPDTPTDCTHPPGELGSTDQVLVSGNLTVQDEPALTFKSQCRNGGWKQFMTPEGARAFMNEGQCIAFVARTRGP